MFKDMSVFYRSKRVMKNAIVLACDNSYMDKLETTIKSM